MIKNHDKIYNGSYNDLKDYTYEKHSSGKTTDSKGKAPKPLTEEKKQEIVTKMLAGASRPNGANRPYGTGDTIASSGVVYVRTGQVNIQGEKGYVAGEVTFLEARARTYQTKTAVGAEAQAGLFRAEYGVKGSTSLVNAGRTEIIGVGGYAKGEGFVGAQVNVQAGAGMKGIMPYAGASVAGFAGVRAGVNAGGEVRLVGVGVRADGEAHAWAGAQGSGNVSVTPVGVKAEVEGFAGAEAGASGTVSIGGIGVKGEADAYAGAGGKAGITIGLSDDGDVTIGAELGGALGLGAGAGLEVSIDTDQLIKDGGALWTNIGNLVNDGGQAAQQGISGAANTAGNVVDDVVNAVDDGANAVGNAVGQGAQAAGNAVGGAVNAVASAFGF